MELHSSFIPILNRSHCCDDYRILRIWPTPVTGEAEKELTLSASACHTGEPNSVSLMYSTLFSPWILRLKIFGRNPLERAHWHEIKDTQWPDRLESWRMKLYLAIPYDKKVSKISRDSMFSITINYLLHARNAWFSHNKCKSVCINSWT